MKTMKKKWLNPSWDPNLLNASNVLTYFCDLTNPFYDHQCNNEKMMMMRGSNDITQMEGDEYSLVHAQEPVLFIVVRNRRRGPTSVQPLGYYYIINGEVMQVPNIAGVVCARLQTSMFHVNQTFNTLLRQLKHHPASGAYSWHNPSCSTQETPEERLRNYGNQFQSSNMPHLMQDWMGRHPCLLPANPAVPAACAPPTPLLVPTTDPSIGAAAAASTSSSIPSSGSSSQPPPAKRPRV